MTHFRFLVAIAVGGLLGLAAPVRAAEVDFVQSGFVNNLGNGTTNISIQSVDITKSFVIAQVRFNSNQADRASFGARLLDSTTLQLVREDNNGNFDVQWYVVTFSSGVFVQRGVVTQTATTINVDLTMGGYTPVADLDDAFVVFNKVSDDNSDPYEPDEAVIAELTAVDNLQFRADGTDAQHQIFWEIVEFTDPNDISVQTGTTDLLGINLTNTITLGTPVDVNTTFLLCSHTTPDTGGADVSERMFRAQLTDAMTITVDRLQAGDDIDEIHCQAVELMDGSQVQHSAQTGNAPAMMAAGVSTATVPLDPAVDPGRSVAFSGVQGYGDHGGGVTTGTTDFSAGRAQFTFGLSATGIQLERNSNTTAAQAGWFAVTFNGPYGGQGGGTQCGTTTTAANGVFTEPINSINPTKSFVMVQSRHDSNRPVGTEFRARLAAPDTLELVRSTNDTSTIEISWCVVTYNYGIRVQRGERVQNGSTMNVPISPVASLNQAFVLYTKTPAPTDVIWSEDDPIIGELTATDNLQFRVQNANGGHTISWEVVEFLNPADVYVQSITTAMGAAQSQLDVALPTPVDPTTAFVLLGFINDNQGADVGVRMLSAEVLDANTVRIERSLTGDPVSDIVLQVIDLKDGSGVQHGMETFAPGESLHVVPIGTVENTRALPFATTQVVSGTSMGRTDYAADDIAGSSSFTFTIPATIAPGNTLEIERLNTNGTATVGWFVWEVPSQVLSSGTTLTGHGVDGAVELSWETGTEIDTLGFNVLRSAERNALYEAINPSLISALGAGNSGRYDYRDDGLTNGEVWWYELEEVHADHIEHIGPVAVRVGEPDPAPSCFCAVTAPASRAGGVLPWLLAAAAALLALRRRRR